MGEDVLVACKDQKCMTAQNESSSQHNCSSTPCDCLTMSSRGEVLKSLQLSLTEDSPDAQVAWDAILCGQDASVQARKPLWGEAIVLPAFSRWKASKHRLLVVANEALCAVLKPEMAHWVKVLGIAALQTDDTGSFGYLVLTPEEITEGKLQFAGQEESCQIILESASSLRSSLQVLPVPNQVIFGVELWDESTRQLASEILDNAITVALPARTPTAQDQKKDQKGEKEQEEDAQLVASFMVCS
eukprot:s2055_g1.t1